MFDQNAFYKQIGHIMIIQITISCLLIGQRFMFQYVFLVYTNENRIYEILLLYGL